jgi:hypothetical protein
VRVAAAGLVAIIAAIAIALHGSARADEASPFPSPSPVATEPPGSGGYVSIAIGAFAANGGTVPAPDASSTPHEFKAASASSYSIELVGRLSQTYIATVDYRDTNIHGADAPLETRLGAAVLYSFPRNNTALGIGYASLQRSTVPTSSNGFGLGAMILPDFSRRVSPYASFFYYPSLVAPENTRGGLSVIGLGIVLSPSRQNGLFERIGFSAQNFGAKLLSPTSLSGVELGVGSTF